MALHPEAVTNPVLEVGYILLYAQDRNRPTILDNVCCSATQAPYTVHTAEMHHGNATDSPPLCVQHYHDRPLPTAHDPDPAAFLSSSSLSLSFAFEPAAGGVSLWDGRSSC